MKRIYFKKVISIILTLCMLIPYVSNVEVKGMMGDTFTEGGLKYLIFKEPQGENNGTVHVGGNNKEATEIIIPSTVTNNGNTYDVVAIDSGNVDEGFYGYNKLINITIPDSITSVGSSAFYNCSSLTSIKIPNSVTSIGDYAFYGCSNLSSIELPNSVTSIGNDVFKQYSSLSSIELPNSITSIGNNAFYGCSSLTSITIPNSVTFIDSFAFSNCNNLKNVTILSDKLESLSMDAFDPTNKSTNFYVVNENTKNLLINSCEISEDKIKIVNPSLLHKLKLNSNGNGTVTGGGTFEEGTTVTITATANDRYGFDGWSVNSGNVILADSTLAQTTFTMPTGDVEITANFSEINIRDTFVDGDLKYEILTLSQDGVNGTVSVSGNNKKATSIIIPSTITNRGNTYDVVEIEDTNVFAEGSFSEYRNLTNIKIPDSITYIGKGAFSNCSRLVNIEIPKLVNYIGSSIFSGCYKLKNITILSDKLERISFNTFDLVSETAKFYVINEDIKSLLINKGEISEDKIEIIDTSLLHTLKLISNDSGTVSGNGIYMEGKKVTILAIANEDYKFNNWTVNSGNVILEDSNSAETTFIMPADDIEITADFFEEKTKYPLTLEANPNTAGEVYGSGNYEAGEIVTITAIPKAGYKFNNWVGNMILQDTILEDTTLAKATLKMPRKNLQLYANFSKVEPGDTFVDGDLRYEIITLSQDGTMGTVNVSGNNKEATEIVIPETVTNNSTTYDVVEIRGTTFNERNGGFFDYKKLKNIVIPDSITSIGLYAFYNCGSLTSIELPKSITSMKEYVFRSCSRLENITILSDKLKTLYYSFSSINENAKFYVVDENTRNLLINQSEISENKIEIIDASKLRKLKLNSNDNGIVSGDGTFEEGKTITIKATANDGYKFDSWTVNSGNVTLEDITLAQTTFVMPDTDVEITANFSELPKHTLVLNSNSDVAGEVYGSGIYKEKEKVTIKATANDGYKFGGWTVNSGNVTLEDSTLAQTTFIMPANDVEITANFSEIKVGDTFVDGDLKYEIITLSKDGANGTVNVSGNNKEATEIVIPRTVTNSRNTYDVVEIKGTTSKEENGGFYEYEKLTNIEIPDSITSIGNSAFYDCSSLISIQLPDSITSINDYTFNRCSSLTSINLPDSVTSIGNSAFRSCSNLTSIELPDSITSIGSFAFAYCSSLTNINLPDSITSIGSFAFYICSSLPNIKLPNSITLIDAYTFSNCSSLINIELPSSITSIHDEAFAYCNKLENITILSNILEIPSDSVFKSINKNAKFYVVNDDIKNLLISKCKISADIIEIIDASKLHTLKLNSNDNGTVSGSGSYMEGKTVTITATAKDSYKFNSWTVNSGNVTLEDSTLAQTTFIMPAEDVEITANFISNNETVETPNKDLIFNIITKPEGETNGTVSVTVNNKDLTSVDIPETIKDKDGNTYTVVEIEDNAFKDCSNLQHIKLPNTIINIGQGAFENCTNLIEITIPSDVTSIGDNAFKGCIILQIVVIISVNITIGKDAFTNVSDNIIYITTNNDTKDKLKPFVKDENQIQVSDGNVKDTSSVIIRTSAGGTATGNGLYKSGDTVNLKATAKDGYKFDKWIVISGDITIENINSETTNFTMPDKNVILMANFVSNSGSSDNNVGDSFVTDDKFIVTVTKPAGSDTQGTVTIVGTTDTSDTITIPSTITDKNGKVYKITFVSDNAFTGNKNITSVIIQNGITSIGNGAFKDCINLIHISIPDSVTSIGDSAFENCTKLEKIEIPSSVILIGNNAFKGCINLSKIIILTIKVIIKNNAFKNISKDASFIVINQEIKNILIQIGIAENQIVISKGLRKVTVKSDSNGVVAGSGTYSKDDTVTIKATPNEKYKFDKWTVNAGNVTLADNKLAETTFTMPDEDVEITASFIKDEIVIESKDNLDFIVQKPATENEDGEVTFKVIDKNVTSVSIPSKVKDNKGNSYVIKIIPNNAFEGCTNLKEIKIPETIISIGDSAFKGCTNLIKIILPDTITVIGSNAFEGCTSLIEITIPKNVELIKDNAFLNCTSLIKVIILSLNSQIVESAFTGMSSNTIFIVLNQEVKAILILCHILEIQIIILDPESNLQEQINKANELLRKSYPTLDEVIQSTMDLSDGIIYYFQSK